MPSDELIPIPADATAREALLHRLEVLGALDHPRVEPVLSVQVRSDSRIAIRRGAGTAADLPTVLAVRGRLSVPEAAGLLVAVAQGLAALHSEGVSHGGVAAADVVLGADGIALLRPRATGDPVAQGSDGVDVGAAHDVHELAVLVAGLLGDRSDDEAVRLRAVLASALAPDPLVRPEAGTFAAQAAAALEVEPVRLPERAQLAVAALGAGRGPRAVAGEQAEGITDAGHPAARRPTVRTPGREVRRRPGSAPPAGAAVGRAGRHRGRQPVHRNGRRSGGRNGAAAPGRTSTGRALAKAAGVVGGVTLVTVLGMAALDGSFGTSSAPAAEARVTDAKTPADVPALAAEASASHAASADRDREDPASAASALTQRRIALLTGGEGTLEDVDLPGSPAHAADTGLVATMEQSGTRVEAVEVLVHETRLEARDEDDRARVAVEYEISAHVQRGADGVRTAVPASGLRSATLGLEWTDDGWRVVAVD